MSPQATIKMLETRPDLADDFIEYSVRKQIHCSREEYLDMPMSKIIHILGFASGTSEREKKEMDKVRRESTINAKNSAGRSGGTQQYWGN